MLGDIMGAREKSEKLYIYTSGYVTDTPIEGIKAPVMFYFEENDGARFLRRGAEAELHIEIAEGVDTDTLGEVVRNLNMKKVGRTVKNALEEMLKKGEVKPGKYEINIWHLYPH